MMGMPEPLTSEPIPEDKVPAIEGEQPDETTSDILPEEENSFWTRLHELLDEALSVLRPAHARNPASHTATAIERVEQAKELLPPPTEPTAST
jgi:hypothetical protein